MSGRLPLPYGSVASTTAHLGRVLGLSRLPSAPGKRSSERCVSATFMSSPRAFAASTASHDGVVQFRGIPGHAEWKIAAANVEPHFGKCSQASVDNTCGQSPAHRSAGRRSGAPRALGGGQRSRRTHGVRDALPAALGIAVTTVVISDEPRKPHEISS